MVFPYDNQTVEVLDPQLMVLHCRQTDQYFIGKLLQEKHYIPLIHHRFMKNFLIVIWKIECALSVRMVPLMAY
jgi:hypothetical protein